MPKTTRKAIDDRLLDTAIEQFGRNGLEGASTRAIAAAAGTAMSSITYHYGGKKGLYLAAARRIAEQIAERLAGTLQGAPDPDTLDAENALVQILALTDAALGLMLSPESLSWSRFIIREQAEPTEGFQILWERVMGPVTGRLVPLVQRAAGGRFRPAEARVRAVTIFGQVLVFRVARAAALRVTGWNDIGPAQTTEIRRVLHAQVRAIVTSS